MSFRGVTFGGQNVTPANDGGLYAAHHGDGILLGCSMSLSGTDLIVSSGEFIACGRVVMVDGSTSVDLSGVSIQNGYVQVIMNLEPTNTPMYYTSLAESASVSFPSLTQQDLNLSGTQYQIELAVVQMVGGSPSSIYRSLASSSVVVKSSLATGTFQPSEIGPSVILSAEQGEIIFRPQGKTDMTYQSEFDTDGTLHVGNSVYVNHPSSDPYIYLLSSGSAKGNMYYDSVNNRIIINNTATGSISIRPNGNTTGEVYFDTLGQQHGGHIYNSDVNTSESISISAGSSFKTIASATGLAQSGVYIFTGKVSFTPTSANSSEIILALSNTSNANNLGVTNQRPTTTTSTKTVNVSMVLSGFTNMYLTFGSTGVGGNVVNHYFTWTRLS